jgi:glycosyl transferase family 25
MSTAGFDDVHAVYISLASRPERRAAIETQCSRVGLAPTPFMAVDCTPKGYLGCTISHLSVLKHAKASGWNHVLILEDDFQFLIDCETLGGVLGAVFARPFDVLMLAYVGRRAPADKFSRALDVQTTAGYVVHSRFFDTLIANFEEGLRLLLKSDDTNSHALDIWWKRLQPTSVWLVCEPRAGKQAPGFSDCVGAFTNYEKLERD